MYVPVIVLRRMAACLVPVGLRLACRPIASASLRIPITHPPQCNSEPISVLRIQACFKISSLTLSWPSRIPIFDGWSNPSVAQTS